MGPHNTWCNPNGSRMYGEVLTLPWVYIFDTATNKVLGRVGPFSKGVRPFTVTDDEKYVFGNVDGLLGYLINPRITLTEGSQEGPEGCLSIPGITAVRRRPARVVAEGADLAQKPVTVEGLGELARCLEHETGHLQGELFIDGLDPGERRRVMPLIS